METVLKEKIFYQLTVCKSILCRDLLIIGGVAAKEQLAILEQGVCIIYCLQQTFKWRPKLM